MAEKIAELEGPDWHCIRCGKLVSNPWTNFLGHVYCSETCADDDIAEEPIRMMHRVGVEEDFGGRY